ncbi:MAG TPA: hypothetical protein VMM76_14490, partial [Pirellulaceae bacterium]|nr:hypothetical protein [Pirellulaceae bacterium]
MTTLLLVAVMLTGQPVPPSAEPESVEAAEAREAIELAQEEVAKYALYQGEDREVKLQLRQEPILRWTNHLRRRFYGDVFIWTHHGRPEAVATITNSYGEYHAMETEVHSLSLAKFTATREDQPMWNPSRAGIELSRVPDAPAVAEVPAQRLQQMRGIARQFSADSSSSPQQLQLRLLPHPVYRYESTVPDLIDGAMFVFANGTDPEIFLLLEARPAGATTRWQYALARFNSHVAFQVFYNRQQVWTVPSLRGGEMKDLNSTYFAFQRRISAP